MDEQSINMIMPDWTLSYVIRERRGEKIFLAESRDENLKNRATIEVVNIPADSDEEKELRELYPSDEEFKEYISSQIKRKKESIDFIKSFNGKPGFVNVIESYDMVSADKMSCVIVTRYDCIDTLDNYIKTNGLTVGAAMKLGIDICKGMEALRSRKKVHGNIRPENIFVDDNGNFRLGGFDTGIVNNRMYFFSGDTMERRYVAPEIYHNIGRFFSSDIYSLGLVLYGLLNGGKLPFEEDFGYEKALEKRTSGEAFPKPSYDAGKFTDIIIKACTRSRKERYVSASEMRLDIEEAFGELQQAMLNKTAEAIAANSSQMMKFSDNKKPDDDPDAFDEKAFDEIAERKRRAQDSSKKSTLLALGAMFAILLLCVAAYFGIGRDIESYGVHLEQGYDYSYTGEEKTPTVTLKTLEEGKQFIVSYSNNKKVGTATVTVKGIGRFRGEKKKTFKIVPNDCKSFAADKVTDSSVKLEWSKTNTADKYRIYIYNEETEDWKRIRTLESYRDSYTVKGLEPDKEYRFKIRAIATKSDVDYKSNGVELTVRTAKAEEK